MRARWIRALVWCLTATGAAVAARSQDVPPLVFRSGIDAIEVELRVVDERGRPISDLHASEVEVLEDGRKQEVVSFTRVTLPVTAPVPQPTRLGPARSPLADVASNRATGARIFVLILDDLHVDRRNTHVVKQAARRFVEEHIGPGDLAAVVYTGVRPDAAQDFTADRQLLLAAIDKFVGRKLPPATVERMEQYNMFFRGRGRPQFEDLRDRHDGERAFNARSAMASIETVSTLLGRVTGRRKAALYFSEGLDYDLSGLRSRGRVPSAATTGPTIIPNTAPTGGGEADAVGRPDVHSYSHDVLLSLQSAVGAASRANVALYAIDVRADNSDALSDLGAPVDDRTLGLAGHDVTQEMRDAQESLVVMATSTGGAAALAPASYGATFERIVRESSDYYLLAYSPWNPAPDGTYREITVRVRRPGARVFARKGYYAPRKRPERAYRFVAPGISSETSTLVMGPVPSAGLALDVQAVGLRHEKKKADVVVTTQVDGRELAGAASGASFSNSLELAVMAIDSSGRVQAATGREIDVRLDPEGSLILRDSGYRVVARLQVPPGRYQIRQAVRERNGGRFGSVFADIEVPDFWDRLSMSGVLLTSQQAMVVPTSVDPDTYQRIPVLPSVRRTFSPDDVLIAAAEVYDSSERGDLELVASVLDPAGQHHYRQAAMVSRSDLKRTRGVFRYDVKIPLENASGDLMLVLEARPANGRGESVVRRVPFSVAAR